MLSALEKGAAADEVVKALAGMRSTGHGAKSDPLGYARKTVKRAQAHLEERAAGGREGDPAPGGASAGGSEDWRQAALRRAGRGACRGGELRRRPRLRRGPRVRGALRQRRPAR